MSGKKQFSVSEYDVQKTFIVEAKDEDEAYDIAYNGEGEVDNEDWEYREHMKRRKYNGQDRLEIHQGERRLQG